MVGVPLPLKYNAGTDEKDDVPSQMDGSFFL